MSKLSKLTDLELAIESGIKHGKEAISSVESVLSELEKGFSEAEIGFESAKFDSDCNIELKKKLDAVLRKENHDRKSYTQAKYSELQKCLEFYRKEQDNFTISLFGRTMSGKSTTMSILTDGDRKRIGDGTPDFTTKIEARKWKGIKVIDTPGTMGFKQSVKEMAQGFVAKSNLVLVVIGDDHIEQEIIDKIAWINSVQKPMAIILNIKGRKDRLLKRENLVFKDDEIEGHINHIQNSLAKHFNKKIYVPVFPVCLDAALASKETDNHATANKLYELSRFSAVTDYIEDLVINKGTLVRVVSPYNALINYLQSYQKYLLPKLAIMKGQMTEMDELERKVKDSFEKVANQGKQKIKAIEQHFLDFDEAIEDFVEQVAEDEIKNPNARFKKIFKEEIISDAEDKIQNEIDQEIKATLDNVARAIHMDLSLVAERTIKKLNFEYDFTDLNWGNFKKNLGKVAKVANPAAAALFTWGISNFWNPGGWLLLVGAGLAWGGKKLAEKMEVSGLEDLKKEKSKIRENIRSILNKRKVDGSKNLNSHLDNQIRNKKSLVLASIDASRADAENFMRVSNRILSLMEDVISRLSLIQLDQLKFIIYGDQEKFFKFKSASRFLGSFTKILIEVEDHHFGKILGREQAHFECLKELFSPGRLIMVTESSSMEKMILTSLGLTEDQKKSIQVRVSDQKCIINVFDPRILPFVYGKSKSNVKTSSALFKLNIIIETMSKDEGEAA